MAHYLITATPKDGLDELKERLDSGEIERMRPFGPALAYGLANARIAPDGELIWEEEDDCDPPLAMEREAVLDLYFSNLGIASVERGGGWERIAELPRLWKAG